MEFINQLKFDENGLIPAIAQDYITNEVLMLAYMNKESLKLTLDTGKVHYYSRSRKKLWMKGETSGNIQYIKGLFFDCDGDTLLLKVEQTGPACHTGNRSCFYNTHKEKTESINSLNKNLIFKNESFKDIIEELYKVVADRRNNHREGSYTNYLFDKGIDKILKKVGEEAAEVIIAAKNNSVQEIKYEMADLVYHMIVLMVESNIDPDEILEELKNRRLKEENK